MTRIRLFLLSIVFFVFNANAALQLELTQGMNAAIPIAVVPFANQANNVPGNTTLSQVISNDLQNSGEFRVATGKDLSQQPQTLFAINFPYWQQQGMSDVVIGQVSPLGGNRFNVSFQLVDVNHQSSSKGTITTLLNDSFHVDQAGLRALAHHISDLIYEKLTGVRGIFSTKIAYVLAQHHANGQSAYQLVVSDQDGFNPQTLLRSSQPIVSPTWSPNGKNIAYVSYENHRARIFEQNVATGHRQVIADYPGMNNAPAFSPDGKRMALVLTKTGNPNLYVMNLSTQQLQQITNDISIDTEPLFSPDGQYLYFTSSRAGGPQIFRYSFQTGQTERVTFEGSYNARACLTPDASTMVMIHRQDGNFNLAKQNLTSGRFTILTNSGLVDSPSLAPNGKMVLYGTGTPGHETLGLASLDGRIKLRLPSPDGDVQSPAWSPYLN